MEIALQKYKFCSKNIKWLLVVSGLWPDFHPVLNKIMAFTTFTATFIVMVNTANFCFHNLGNVMVLTRGMGLTISFSSAFMKVCMFLLHYNDLVHLNTVLTKRYYLSDLESYDHWPDLLSNIKSLKYFMNSHAASIAVAMSMYAIKPIQVLRKTGKYVRAFPTVVPFYYEPGGLVHWILYAVEATAALSLWTVTVGVDCAFGMYALQICGELRLLAKRFENMSVGPDYEKNLKDCIQRHYMLINAKNKLESIFGLITIWLAISGALVLCSLIFQITEIAKSNASIMHTAHLSCYLIPKFLQIFAYAWYGNLIATESEECLASVYKSHWSDCYDLRFKNDVLIILTQEPLTLIAKGCMIIQLDLFTKIVKTSLSYFCLLRTLNDAE